MLTGIIELLLIIILILLIFCMVSYIYFNYGETECSEVNVKEKGDPQLPLVPVADERNGKAILQHDAAIEQNEEKDFAHKEQQETDIIDLDNETEMKKLLESEEGAHDASKGQLSQCSDPEQHEKSVVIRLGIVDQNAVNRYGEDVVIAERADGQLEAEHFKESEFLVVPNQKLLTESICSNLKCCFEFNIKIESGKKYNFQVCKKAVLLKEEKNYKIKEKGLILLSNVE